MVLLNPSLRVPLTDRTYNRIQAINNINNILRDISNIKMTIRKDRISRNFGFYIEFTCYKIFFTMNLPATKELFPATKLVFLYYKNIYIYIFCYKICFSMLQIFLTECDPFLAWHYRVYPWFLLSSVGRFSSDFVRLTHMLT